MYSLMPKVESKPQFNPYPSWCARFWHGMRLGDWIKLVARNRFRIHPLRWGLATTVTLATTFNSAMYGLQQAIYGRRIRQTPITEDPVFIIGHWRSGTTYLHELMVLDDRFTYPTTYECFAPNHFLVTERVCKKLLWFAVPAQRPMDNVKVGWDNPQEDEFALCGLGLPSPYLRMAFPNGPDTYDSYLDLDGLREPELERWKEGLARFVKMLALKHGKRVILKSPTHTGRLGVLAEMFPGARFIHVVRHPDALFPSTIRLWQSLDLVQGLQIPRHERLAEYVHTAYERMYRSFERHRANLPSSRICDVRYEDLIRDPVGELARVYEQLDLGDFEPVRERIEEHVARQKGYKVNRHELDEKTRSEIRLRWGRYIDRYGYADEPARV
jgi:hypothetical protein